MSDHKLNKNRVVLALTAIIGVLMTLGIMTPALAENAETDKNTSLNTLDYGRLFMIERREAPTKAWLAAISYKYEFSNPYLSVHGLSLGIDRQIWQFGTAGIRVSKYFNVQNKLYRTISEKLQKDSIMQSVPEPDSSAYATISLVPLSGHWSFFNHSSLPVELCITFGAGTTYYQTSTWRPALLWELKPRIMITNLLGLELGAGQELEAPFSSDPATRTQAGVGLMVRL